MRPRDIQRAEVLNSGLDVFVANHRQLPGIQAPARRLALVEQLLESIHRIEFVAVLRGRPLSNARKDPESELFDPLRAAILHQRGGNLDEAFWLVFLFVHFGKHLRGGWRYVREVYGRLGQGGLWDWASVSVHPAAFRTWLGSNEEQIRRPEVPGGFGNHRKYESLSGQSAAGTGAVVESYVAWVNPPRTHSELIEEARIVSQNDPRTTFSHLYDSMHAVARFGRTARFDYITMLGKLGLAPVVAPSAYLQNATGPRRGAQLLFGGNHDASALDAFVVELDSCLNVGMQVLEDALCNWQKSPDEFVPFRG